MGQYWVCWTDGVQRGVVASEGPAEGWSEAEGVCDVFRTEDTGDKFYVGDRNANPLNPTVEEAESLLNYLIERGYISPADYHLLEYFINRVADFERGREVMKEHFEELRRAKARFDDDEV